MKSQEREPSHDAKTEPQKKGLDDSSLFEKVIPEGIKRGFESLLKDGRIKNAVGDLKLPKEIVNHIFAQIDETKHSALNVIGKEIRVFLERINLGDELARMLTQVSFEVKTNVRFVPNEKAMKKQGQKDKENEPASKEKLDGDLKR